MLDRTVLMLSGAVVAIALAAAAHAGQEQHHDMMMHKEHTGADSAPVDARAIVHFPEKLRTHILANMRDHLQALSEIQEALAKEQFEQAGEIAEHRLGMSSLKLHGAHEARQYMPTTMATIGAGMHHAASRFAVAASDAAVAGDMKPVLSAFTDITRQCVACHNGFRVK